jgi:transposase
MTVETPAIRSVHGREQEKYDQQFKDDAVRIVEESGKPIAQVARDLGVHEGTLGNWVAKARAAAEPGGLSADERDELRQLRQEVATLRMERRVLKRSVVLWVKLEALGHNVTLQPQQPQEVAA